MNPDTEDRAAHASVPAIEPSVTDEAVRSKSILGRVVRALMLTVVVIGGAILAMYKMRVDIPSLNTSQIYAHLDSAVARAEGLKGYYESHFGKHVDEGVHHEEHKLVVTSPIKKDVVITQSYVCQIHSQRHIELCALEDGYLEAIAIKEGQEVKKGELMFQVIPVIYKAELAAELAERDLAQLELTYTQTLADKQGVSQKEVQLFKAKLAKAQAKVDLAQAKLNFTSVKAPFDGIIDRLKTQQGSLVKEGDMLTTLSDNSLMWVYFNVTEKRYLEYMAETGQNKQSPDIYLKLADQSMFPHVGKIGAIEANFNNENGNIAFRADFPNPDRLLRHGQTGTVLINRPLKGAIVIPQRATFENLAKRYAYVVDKDDKVHQREIVVDHELDDIFVISKGLDVHDKIVLEGIRQVRDGEKVEYEYLTAEEAMAHPKFHAE
ncbi:efflux RND transporter periplasmic adaptor subunit [Tundrisphaera lichenicola]|uniref:efflux RND transporter periplasmic adaptor subunit n=1 Tax=Tundrisphaera lichenicola TaxID=2029860 RepID=UPI003EB7E3E0